MLSPPPLPESWDGFHPLLVHFPVALLVTAPVFIVLGLLVHRLRNPLNLAALVLMVLGSIGAWLAVWSGEAAEKWVDEAGEVKQILNAHERAAEMAWRLSILMSLIFAAYTIVPWMRKKPWQRKWIAACGVAFLLAYALPCIVVANAAHLGGRLVHEQGVRGRVTPKAAASIDAMDADDGEAGYP